MPRRCCIVSGRVYLQGDGSGIGLQQSGGLHRSSFKPKETVTPIIFMDKFVRSSVHRSFLGDASPRPETGWRGCQDPRLCGALPEGARAKGGCPALDTHLAFFACCVVCLELFIW